jgi:hypothetical protein
VGPGAHGVLGIAPHSGWAAAVLIAGPPAAPRVILRERLELAARELAGSRQPYHEVEGLPLAQAERRLAALLASAVRLAGGALERLIERARTAGVVPRAAGILDSSGQGGAPLATILASHALIHTADGNHFRDALTQACEGLGLSVARVPQRELTARAATALGRSSEQLAASVKELGRGMGSPWGADQKSAALLAWLLLARGARG